MVHLKSEEYAGHKIWFEQPFRDVNAKVNIDGIWYGVTADTKKEAFHRMKIIIVDVLKKGNFQEQRNHVLTSSWGEYTNKYFGEFKSSDLISINNTSYYYLPNNNSVYLKGKGQNYKFIKRLSSRPKIKTINREFNHKKVEMIPEIVRLIQ